MKTALLCLTWLLLLATSSAQVATIDLRGQKPTRPSVSIGQGTGRGSRNHQALELILSLPDASNLVVGQPFDYELWVTNRTDKAIQLPQALAWSEVDDADQRVKRYQHLQISFEIFASDGNRGFVYEDMTLYGNEARPATMVTLQPGESLRILGSIPFAPQWEHPPAKAAGMRLMGFLTVASGILSPLEGQDDRYRSDERQIYSSESDGNLPIEVQTPQ